MAEHRAAAAGGRPDHQRSHLLAAPARDALAAGHGCAAGAGGPGYWLTTRRVSSALSSMRQTLMRCLPAAGIGNVVSSVKSLSITACDQSRVSCEVGWPGD